MPSRVALCLVVLASSARIARAEPAEPSGSAAKLAGAALVAGRSYDLVQSLTDRVGGRLSGSPGAERAVEWALHAMRDAGLSNVRREPVKVPRWIRGTESVEVVAPVTAALVATALGGSVGTPPGGITAEVIEVASFEELKAAGDKVKGRIVFFNKPMNRTRRFEGYGAVVPLRGFGAVEAAKLGAVGALLRSVGTGAHRLPHTGTTHYDDKVTQIPYAALAIEDAEQLHRLIAGGEKVRVRMTLGCRREPDAESANVVGELPGSELPDQVVLIGAHLDSWDLGEGAIDDGAGCAVVLETVRLIKALGWKPRRTLRVVLFMNEENGLAGGRAYAERHRAELPRHVAAMESDAGAGRPLGFEVGGGPSLRKLVGVLAAPLAIFGASDVAPTDEAGADLIPLHQAGVPVLAVAQDVSNYFDWHHTAGDTLDKIDKLDLAMDLAAFAVMAWGLADAKEIARD
jgi:Zn-dependent M28 family amino/carboxypeptidase